MNYTPTRRSVAPTSSTSRPFRVLSVCSGLGGCKLSISHARLPWSHTGFAEIDPAACAVLHHHYPHIHNYGDFTKITFTDVGGSDTNPVPVDLLCGGTPCQAFSVAGKRLGVADPRGNLTLEFLALADRVKPRWIVWENVPGVLSIDGGRTFGTVLGTLAKLGYGFAYRVLDAQYAGVPQRRRRVFVVGCAGGDWRRAAAVLFEPESVRRHITPSRKAGEGVSLTISARVTGGGGLGTDFDCDGGLVTSSSSSGPIPILEAGARTGKSTTDVRAGMGVGEPGDPMFTLQSKKQHAVSVAFGGNNTSGPIDVATACNAHGGSGRVDFESETFVTHALDAFSAGRCTEDGTGRGTPLVPVFTFQNTGQGYWNDEDVAQTLRTAHSNLVAFSCKDHGADAGDLAPTLRAMPHHGSHPNAGGQVAITFTERGRDQGRTFECQEEVAYCLTNPAHSRQIITPQMAVRRLTPREYERLQGIPDSHTLIPYHGHLIADGPRYKLIGNGWAIPVVAWIFNRISIVDKLQ